MTYSAPVAETAFFLEHCTSLKKLAGSGAVADLTQDVVQSVLEEAGKFAGEVIAPLNRIGDTEGAHFANGKVTMPKGFLEAYRGWAGAGWSAVSAPQEWGGQGLPTMLNASCIEFWNSACMSFAIGPVVSMAAIEAFHVHGTEALKQQLSAEDRHRRMDGDDAAHRAAGRLRSVVAAHQGDAPEGRHLPAAAARRSSSPTASTI